MFKYLGVSVNLKFLLKSCKVHINLTTETFLSNFYSGLTLNGIPFAYMKSCYRTAGEHSDAEGSALF